MSGVLVIAMLLDHYKACWDYLQAKRPDLGTSITYKKHTLSRGGLGLPNPQGTAGSKNEDSAITTESKSTNKNLTSQFTKKKLDNTSIDHQHTKTFKSKISQLQQTLRRRRDA